MDDTGAIFDLRDAIAVLQAAELSARRLDALEVPMADDDAVQTDDPAVAAAFRDLEHLMHLCDRARAEVAATYWSSRGYPDPAA